jgi:hypothetical protein
VYTSPVHEDWFLVVVGGLDPAAAPYRVEARDGAGRRLLIGVVRSLDSGGGAAVWREFTRRLEPFDRIVVRDRAGSPALAGRIPASSPTPAA